MNFLSLLQSNIHTIHTSDLAALTVARFQNIFGEDRPIKMHSFHIASTAFAITVAAQSLTNVVDISDVTCGATTVTVRVCNPSLAYSSDQSCNTTPSSVAPLVSSTSISAQPISPQSVNSVLSNSSVLSMNSASAANAGPTGGRNLI